MKFLKIIVFIISICFLIYISLNNYNIIKESLIFKRKNLIFEIIILSIIYAFSFTFLAISWRNILNLLSKKKLSFSLIWIWIKSNIYKYLPGNIFHYAFRQVMGKNMGISHKFLLQSNLIEAILMIFVANILSIIILVIIYDFKINEYLFFINQNYLYFLIFLFIIIFIYLCKYKQIKIIDYWQNLINYVIFFIGIGVSAYYILNYQMNIKFPFLLITAIYTFAWLIGFITPGAPGGIGVRESVFIFLSHGILKEADAIVLSGMIRLISLVGEIILFILANKILQSKEMKN